MPHVWANQEMMIGLDFEIEPFRAALEIFNFMEVAELIYEGARAHYQNNTPFQMPTEPVS